MYSQACHLLDATGVDDLNNTASYVLALALDNVSDVFPIAKRPGCFIGTIESCCCDMDALSATQAAVLRRIADDLYATNIKNTEFAGV
jgi:hypothetical protein